MRKIFDCFNFFNELDILELRLNILYDHVDYFIIVESNLTHSGEEKPFYYEINKERFSKFSDKIIPYKILDNPKDFENLEPTDDPELQKIQHYMNHTHRFNKYTQPDYGRDFFQKESVRRALVGCDDEDVIIFSDADEIPNPYILENIYKLDLDNSIYALNQYTYYYYLNVLKQRDWFGSRIGSYKNMKRHSFNEIRGNDGLSIRLSNGGWHFSFMGGKEMVKSKLLSYSARDMVYDRVINEISNNMENNVDPFFRSNLETVPIDETFPKYLLNNIDTYKHLIK